MLNYDDTSKEEESPALGYPLVCVTVSILLYFIVALVATYNLFSLVIFITLALRRRKDCVRQMAFSLISPTSDGRSHPQPTTTEFSSPSDNSIQTRCLRALK